MFLRPISGIRLPHLAGEYNSKPNYFKALLQLNIE